MAWCPTCALREARPSRCCKSVAARTAADAARELTAHPLNAYSALNGNGLRGTLPASIGVLTGLSTLCVFCSLQAVLDLRHDSGLAGLSASLAGSWRTTPSPGLFLPAWRVSRRCMMCACHAAACIGCLLLVSDHSDVGGCRHLSNNAFSGQLPARIGPAKGLHELYERLLARSVPLP
jgi:hypothetical protein